MPTINTLNDTPVRHDDYSITKTSLLYRPKHKCTVEKINRVCVEEKWDENTSNVSFSCENINFAPLEIQFANADSKTDNDVSVITVDEMETTRSTSFKGSLSRKYTSDEEVMISMKKLTTPEYIEAQTKAVSSTPNQDILNTCKLKRNVASQTTHTLNARALIEYNEDIKSCIIEIPEERSDSVLGISQISHCNMDVTSPSRSLCTSKLANCNTPVDHKMTNVRKLSLRSKTMITSAMERSKDMFPKYKSLEEKRIVSNTFSLLPRPNTPPSCSEKVIHNPFEVDLSERLGKSIFSPNVFENVLSPSEDSDSIRWTIEDISSINPVAIEEDFTLPSDDEDPERESQVQQEIERYFSETHSVLSPEELYQSRNGQNKKIKQHMRAAASTPQKAALMISKEFTCANVQTVLSLPEVLSKELECSLRNIFKLFETDDFNMSASNLRRKLFFHSEDEPPSPVRFEMHSSPIARDSWDLDHSPYADSRRGRHFTPLAHQAAFSSPEISPVVRESTNVKLSNNLQSSCKKTLDYIFSGNQLHTEGENKDFSVGALENSTVIMHSINGLGEMVVDSESNSASSAMPSSQDTGYHTEESWQHCHPFSMMASTPTRRSD